MMTTNKAALPVVEAGGRPANERKITPSSTYPRDDCITEQRTGQAFSEGGER